MAGIKFVSFSFGYFSDPPSSPQSFIPKVWKFKWLFFASAYVWKKAFVGRWQVYSSTHTLVNYTYLRYLLKSLRLSSSSRFFISLFLYTLNLSLRPISFLFYSNYLPTSTTCIHNRANNSDNDDSRIIRDVRVLVYYCRLVLDDLKN